jgi:hypothetical protein
MPQRLFLASLSWLLLRNLRLLPSLQQFANNILMWFYQFGESQYLYDSLLKKEVRELLGHLCNRL